MPRYTVTILRKGQQLKKVFSQESFSVGRSLDCDLSLDDLGVSRVQLVVFHQGDQIYIEDKNSSNGTFLNQTRILQNTPVNVVPTDSIQLGKTSYVISIDLELEEDDSKVAQPTFVTSHPNTTETSEAAALPEPQAEVIMADSAPAGEKSSTLDPAPIFAAKEVLAMPFIIANDNISKDEEDKESSKVLFNTDLLAKAEPPPSPEPEPVVETQRPPPPPIPVEVVAKKAVIEPSHHVNDARKQAAQIIYDGEVQAEKRVQSIYRKAQELQEQTELESKEILRKAQEEAEQILSDHQAQGQELLHQARSLAQELREEVEVYVASLKEKARSESEALIKEAHDKAKGLAERLQEQFLNESKSKAEETIAQAEREAHDLVHFAQLQSEEYKISLIEAQRKAENDVLECKRIEEDLVRLQTEHTEQENKKTALQEQIKAEEENFSQVNKDLTDLRNEKSELETQFRLLQQKEADAQQMLLALTEKNAQAQKTWEGQKGELEKSLQIKKIQADKEAVDYGQHLKLELNKKMAKMEEELFQSLVDKRDTLTKEIFSAVEKQVVQITEPAQWTAICQQTHQTIQDVIENKLVSFSHVATSNEKSVDLKAKKRSEATRWALVGMTCGMLVFFFSTKFYNTITQEQTLVQRQMASDAQARQDDLQKRQFNPVQTMDLKDTYTDAVIYTTGYTNKYLSPAFQEKFFKASSAYLLKTWRVDEEHAMKAVAISASLVKELAEKRQALHPDFISDGISKMRALEQQNMARLKEVLGSEVRLESYRKFERRFYTENGL